MKKIIAFGASTSKQSINQKLAIAVGTLINDVDLIVIDLNEFEAPLYSVDREQETGFPKVIQKLNTLFAETDGFVISMAEHNGSYSAAFKNTYDWLSRVDKVVWKNKPMLLMATSPGARGGKGVLEAASATFPRMGANLVATFSLPSFHTNFSSESITDPELKKELMDKTKTFEAALSA